MQKKSFSKWVLKNRINLIILIVSLVSTLCVIEFVNYLFMEENSYVWPPNLDRVFLPNSNVVYGVEGDSHFTINKLGYRGPLIKDKEKEYRILTVGGSTTECLYLDDQETWPYLIMKKLGATYDGREVIVMNIGKSGHNTRDHILQLKYLIKEYEPDLIIAMVGANDMLLKLSKRWVWKPFNESSYDPTKTFYNSPEYSWRETLTYKFFEFLYFKFYLKLEPQDLAGENYIEPRLERKNAAIKIDEVPDLVPVLEDYENNLDRLIEIAKENNVTMLFATQPYLWKRRMSDEEDSALWMTTDFNGNFYETEVMIKSMDKFNDRLLEVCPKNKDVLCFDLERKVPKSLEFFYDDMHFNEKGAELVAGEFAKFISSRIFD